MTDNDILWAERFGMQGEALKSLENRTEKILITVEKMDDRLTKHLIETTREIDKLKASDAVHSTDIMEMKNSISEITKRWWSIGWKVATLGGSITILVALVMTKLL